MAKYNDIDLAFFLKLVKKWWKLIVALTITTTMLAAIISYFVLKPVYQASTLLMVTVASETLQVSSQQLNRSNTPTDTAPMPVLTMNTYLGQLKSEVVMKRVVDNTNIPGLTINNLLSIADAKIVEDSNLIILKTTHNDPVLAAQIANAISEQYLTLMDELMFSSVVVISPANVPDAPIKPFKKLNVMVAFVLGFVLSILLSFLLEYLDNTLKTVEDVNLVLDLPVLAVIPSRTDSNTRQNH